MATHGSMRTGHPAPDERPAGTGAAVVGWLVLCFAIIPLAMAVHGDGRVYTTIGLVMLGAGGLMVLVSRLASRGGGGRGPASAPDGL
jgi:hypothetical protein